VGDEGGQAFCLGLEWLGRCPYKPGQPFGVYFSLGEVIGALAFTLAVQQLLKPIYIFRLNARRTPIAALYVLVLLGSLSVIFAAIIPNLPDLHTGFWGYAIVWELFGALLFCLAYGAVVLAVMKPVTATPRTMIAFCRSSVRTLAAATEADIVDYARDLERSLPALIKAAQIHRRHFETPSAFYQFKNRVALERGSYAANLLAVLADPLICRTLVSRCPWRTAAMVMDVSVAKIHSEHAEPLVRELAHQAVTGPASMMTREVRYLGFGTAPVLSDCLFSSAFIVDRYNPFDWVFSDYDPPSVNMLKRYNSAAKRAVKALIKADKVEHTYAVFHIRSFYKALFAGAYKIQREPNQDYAFVIEMMEGAALAIELAQELETSVSPDYYASLFVDDPTKHRSDMMEALVDIIVEALQGIANKFKGFEDPFWSQALKILGDVFPQFRDQPDGLTPLQQRVVLKLIGELEDNMKGFYPAISRVMLACVGPYERNALQPGRTAFNILRDGMYLELKKLPLLAASKPKKLLDFLPDNLSFEYADSTLTHTYRDGAKVSTNLRTLLLPAVSLVDPALRRPQPLAES